MIKKYIVEPRDAKGTLLTYRIGKFESEFQFDPLDVTEKELFNDFFRKNVGKASASWEELRDFYAKQELTIREKTW